MGGQIKVKVEEQFPSSYHTPIMSMLVSKFSSPGGRKEINTENKNKKLAYLCTETCLYITAYYQDGANQLTPPVHEIPQVIPTS